MKLRTIVYSMYMVLSILVSISLAAVPAIVLLLLVYQNLDPFVGGIWSPLGGMSSWVQGSLGTLMPTVFYDHFWFIVLAVPAFLFCYSIFLGLLAVLFKASRRLFPHYKDGYYSMEDEEWLVYEYSEIYYVLFPRFAWFFSVFIDTKPRHLLFGAKIGKNTVVGNGRLFNPERTTIGDNCFFGYDAILSGHVYEGNRLYLKSVRVGNNVTIGANAVILPGADIGDNVIIGANTTVPKDRVIPSDTIWVHGKAIPRKLYPAEAALTPVLDPADVVDTPPNGQHI